MTDIHIFLLNVLRSVEIFPGKFFLDHWSAVQDIVSECADDRKLHKIFEYFFAVPGITPCFCHIFRIDHHEPAEIPGFCVACQKDQR